MPTGYVCVDTYVNILTVGHPARTPHPALARSRVSEAGRHGEPPAQQPELTAPRRYSQYFQDRRPRGIHAYTGSTGGDPRRPLHPPGRRHRVAPAGRDPGQDRRGGHLPHRPRHPAGLAAPAHGLRPRGRRCRRSRRRRGDDRRPPATTSASATAAAARAGSAPRGTAPTARRASARSTPRAHVPTAAPGSPGTAPPYSATSSGSPASPRTRSLTRATPSSSPPVSPRSSPRRSAAASRRGRALSSTSCGPGRARRWRSSAPGAWG